MQDISMVSFSMVLTAMFSGVEAQEFFHQGLRATFLDGSPSLSSIATRRTVTAEDDYVLISQSLAFQVTATAVLSLFALLQLGLFALFVYHRKKRNLELAQPLVIGMMVAAGIVITLTCNLFIYKSDTGCAVREPIIFIAWTIIGATVAGRAWRISALLNSVTHIGQSNVGGQPNCLERSRQFILHALSILSGCSCSFYTPRWGRSSSSLTVQISFNQLMRAIAILTMPSLILQIAIVAHPALRSSKQLTLTELHEISVGSYECKNTAAGSWHVYLSTLFSTLPLVISYIINVRPRCELDMLPGVIDERDSLRNSFSTVLLLVISADPVLAMSVSHVQAYAAITIVLAGPLTLCYYVAYKKLGFISLRHSSTRNNGLVVSALSDDDGDETALSVKMAELYENIGRVNEAVQLVDETLNTWRKGAGKRITNIGQKEEKEVASGFTTNDIESLGPDELELVIHLLRIKARAVMKLDGDQRRSASLNVDALRIYENSPAASKLKDISIIFPVYNWVGIQLKGGLIEQDDERTLEFDLAQRFRHEAQVQSYHYARSLANQAEILGQTGNYPEAFECFNIMKSIYMKEHHPQLLSSAYAVDRCALAFTACALFELKVGRKEKAIEQCNFVVEHVLPSYDQKDVIGLFTMVMQIIRVFKWNGLVDQALEIYHRHLPNNTENHFAVGTLHRPMILLLRICDESSLKYTKEDMQADIELALESDVSDMTDCIYTADGWSMKSLLAEICLHLARRLQPGNAVRESLVRRGIHMSTVADQRIKAPNGMIKHMLAFDVHAEIHRHLLKLANEDSVASRRTVYTKMSNGSDKPKSLNKFVSFDESLGSCSKTLADRLLLKDENSDSTPDRQGILKNITIMDSFKTSAPSCVDPKKRESFSQVSSIEFQTQESGGDSVH